MTEQGNTKSPLPFHGWGIKNKNLYGGQIITDHDGVKSHQEKLVTLCYNNKINLHHI